jgi:hypothetical protein
MSEQRPNHIVGPPGNDDLIYDKPVETFFICISCFNAVRTEISCGWGISEHIPMKSLDTSHICITYCARCDASTFVRDKGGEIRAVVSNDDFYVKPNELSISAEYQRVKLMCTNTPELVCWSKDDEEHVAYVPIKMIEKHHFIDKDVVCVIGSQDMIGKVDMSFFVTSRYV